MKKNKGTIENKITEQMINQSPVKGKNILNI